MKTTHYLVLILLFVLPLSSMAFEPEMLDRGNNDMDERCINIPFIVFGKGGLVIQPGQNPQICPESCFLCKCATGTISLSALWNSIWDNNLIAILDENVPLEANVTIYNSDNTQSNYTLKITKISCDINYENDCIELSGNCIEFEIE
ncbi:MAG: hypothetical protein HPY80_08015 [Bacteroidales bacterium]|nr:hypothetical protein [Bacteroidales bacterium]